MANCEKILLAGFAGAGKSTLLDQLKRSSGDSQMEFSDLDQLLFQMYRQDDSNLAQLIERLGWEKFRSLEQEMLKAWISNGIPGVLALGGGSLSSTTDLSRGCWIYLEVQFKECFRRMKEDPNGNRPLLKEGEAFLHKKYLERLPFYQKLPHKLDGSLPPAILAKKVWSIVAGNG